MKKKIIFFLLLFIFQFNLTSSFAAEKVSFIDLDYIIKNSNIGKLTLENIKKLDQENIKKLKIKNKELQDLETKLNSQKNIISKEAYEIEVEKLKIKINEYSIEKNEMVKNFNKYKKEELDKVFKKITPIIRDYMDKNSVSILMDTKNIFMGKISSNLTEEILKDINKSLN
tara:strand:- start:6 stop:518 length:513 start_codon:yes stop_codon:yes gene_type:complete